MARAAAFLPPNIAAVGHSRLSVASVTRSRRRSRGDDEPFRTLGVSAEADRLFHDGEDAPGARHRHRLIPFAERQLGGAVDCRSANPDRGRAGARSSVSFPIAGAIRGVGHLASARSRSVARIARNRHLEPSPNCEPGMTVEAADRDMTPIGAAAPTRKRDGDAGILPFADRCGNDSFGPARSRSWRSPGTMLDSARGVRERRRVAARTRHGERAGDCRPTAIGAAPPRIFGTATHRECAARAWSAAPSAWRRVRRASVVAAAVAPACRRG